MLSRDLSPTVWNKLYPTTAKPMLQVGHREWCTRSDLYLAKLICFVRTDLPFSIIDAIVDYVGDPGVDRARTRLQCLFLDCFNYQVFIWMGEAWEELTADGIVKRFRWRWGYIFRRAIIKSFQDWLPGDIWERAWTASAIAYDKEVKVLTYYPGIVWSDGVRELAFLKTDKDIYLLQAPSNQELEIEMDPGVDVEMYAGSN